jgi:hypothetical protein
MEDDALSTALSIDELTDPNIGYVTAEMAYAADALARKKPAKIVLAGREVGIIAQIPENADAFVAKVLGQQATAAALIAQVVQPVLDGVGAVMKKEGKRIAIALGKQIANELKPLQEALKTQSKLMEAMTKQMSKLGSERSSKRERGDKPQAAEPPESARKAKRKVAEPSSSKKPGKRDRSSSIDKDVERKLKDYDTLLSKISAAEGGDAMVDNFMGAGFVKRQRGESEDDSNDEMSDEESESDSE